MEGSKKTPVKKSPTTMQIRKKKTNLNQKTSSPTPVTLSPLTVRVKSISLKSNVLSDVTNFMDTSVGIVDTMYKTPERLFVLTHSAKKRLINAPPRIRKKNSSRVSSMGNDDHQRNYCPRKALFTRNK